MLTFSRFYADFSIHFLFTIQHERAKKSMYRIQQTAKLNLITLILAYGEANKRVRNFK